MKCSVVLPVFNGGQQLRVAIESILRQDEPDFELLVIDDHSKDASARVIREYSQKDQRIRGIFHDHNSGLTQGLNEGLTEARSDFVVRMDHDDQALPHRLRTLVGYMLTHPDTVVAGSYVYHMGRTPQLDRLVTFPTEHEDIVRALPSGNCIYHPAVIMRRKEILNLGGYRAEFGHAEDYDLWLRAGQRFRLANIPIPLLRYRFSPGGVTLSGKWRQMFAVQMALAAYRDPSLSGAQLRGAADAALAQIDKNRFLEDVARGTIAELTRLHLWRDALRVLFRFSRQLEMTRSLALARDSAASMFAEYFNHA